MIHVPAETLQPFVGAIFIAAGCGETEGQQIAKSLVSANLAGHDSHGVARVPRYLHWKRTGAFVAGQQARIVSETPVLAVVDGQYGFGQVIAPQAAMIGIRKAQAMGLAMIALRDAGHVGRVGEWAEMAAEAGLVSVHFVNAAGSLLVAPYGGTERRMSTAPFCVGVPRPGEPPLVLDFATSLVAEGKVLVASLGGKDLPADALVGPDGATSGDPHVLYGDYAPSGPRDNTKGAGAIRAFGEHKGSGLAFMCELLGGALTGTGAATPGRRWANGMLSFYIDPARIDPEGFFPVDLARYVAFYKSAKPVEAGGEVLVPGEPEIRTRERRLADGIPIPDDAWEAIGRAAADLGVPVPQVPVSKV